MVGKHTIHIYSLLTQSSHLLCLSVLPFVLLAGIGPRLFCLSSYVNLIAFHQSFLLEAFCHSLSKLAPFWNQFLCTSTFFTALSKTGATEFCNLGPGSVSLPQNWHLGECGLRHKKIQAFKSLIKPEFSLRILMNSSDDHNILNVPLKNMSQFVSHRLHTVTHAAAST